MDAELTLFDCGVEAPADNADCMPIREADALLPTAPSARPPAGSAAGATEMPAGLPGAPPAIPSGDPASAAAEQPPVILEYRLSVSLTPDEWSALEQARRLVRARLPEGDLGRVVGYVLREFVATRGESRRHVGRQPPARVRQLSDHETSGRPARRATPAPPMTESASFPVRSSGRYIPLAVRRAVWERDGGRCAFVAGTGRRCGEVDRLEFHHRLPFRAGGTATPGNLELRCRPHNQMEETGAPSAWRGPAGQARPGSSSRESAKQGPAHREPPQRHGLAPASGDADSE